MELGEKPVRCPAEDSVKACGEFRRTDYRECVRCRRKCRLVEVDYPLAFRARELRGDGTDG